MTNLKMAKQFFEALDDLSNQFTFQLFDDSKGNIIPPKILHGSIDELYEELKLSNERGYGIFVQVNQTNLKGRSAQATTHVRAFWAEKDEGEFVDLPLTPTITIKSKRGKHLYWVLSKFIEKEKVDDFVPILKSIASKLDSDPAVCDISRVLRVPGFYHRKDPSQPYLVTPEAITGEYYSYNEIKEAFPPLQRGRPKRSEAKVENIKEGSRKMTLLSLAGSMRRRGMSPESIFVALMAENTTRCNPPLDEGEIQDIINSVSKYEPEASLEDKQDSVLGKKIITSEFYEEVSSTSKPGLWVINKEFMSVEKMNERVVSRIMGGSKVLADLIRPCYVEYNPFLNKMTYESEKGTIVNVYNPPDWKRSNFYKGTEIEYSEMPLQFQEFFDHLFGEYTESREYVLDWIAHSIQEKKNTTILALTGTNEGIGKGALTEVIAHLHGVDNSTMSKQSILNKEFNKSLMNKTFAAFDEVSIKSTENYESIKAYANQRTAIEGKGVESETVEIFANLMLTNNKIDSLSGVNAKTDRRFSVPQITKTTLEAGFFRNNSFGIRDYKELLIPELIKQLAGNLYYRDLSNYKHDVNFKSPHYFLIVRNSQPDWVRILLEDYRSVHINCAIPIREVGNAISKHIRCSPGEKALIPICEENKEKLAIKRIGLVPHLVFAKEEEIEYNFKLRVYNLDKNNNSGFEILKLSKSLI